MDRYSNHDSVNGFGCEIYLARFEMYLLYVTCPSWYLVLLWWVFLHVNLTTPFNNADYLAKYRRNTRPTEVHVLVVASSGVDIELRMW